MIFWEHPLSRRWKCTVPYPRSWLEINQSIRTSTPPPLLHIGKGGLRLGSQLTCIVFLYKIYQVDLQVLKEIFLEDTVIKPKAVKNSDTIQLKNWIQTFSLTSYLNRFRILILNGNVRYCTRLHINNIPVWDRIQRRLNTGTVTIENNTKK